MTIQLTQCTLTESTISRESHLSSDDVMHASMYHKHPKRSAGTSELGVHWEQLPPSDFGRSKAKHYPSEAFDYCYLATCPTKFLCLPTTLFCCNLDDIMEFANRVKTNLDRK